MRLYVIVRHLCTRLNWLLECARVVRTGFKFASMYRHSCRHVPYERYICLPVLRSCHTTPHCRRFGFGIRNRAVGWQYRRPSTQHNTHTYAQTHTRAALSTQVDNNRAIIYGLSIIIMIRFMLALYPIRYYCIWKWNITRNRTHELPRAYRDIIFFLSLVFRIIIVIDGRALQYQWLIGAYWYARPACNAHAH